MSDHFRTSYHKFVYVCILLVIFSLDALSGSQFDNKYNHFGGEKITRFKICGERCSGTNFVMHLLHANFPNFRETSMFEFGHKHFLWWFGTPIDYQKLQKLKYTQNAVDMSGSQDCLFVVVIRDPYDWLRSFYLATWFVHEDLLGRGISHFLKTEWKLSDVYHRYLPNQGQYGEIDNCNPWTGKPFANVIQMREYKIKNYLILGKLVDNYLFIKYEDVSDNPEEFINFVSTYFNLVKKNEFSLINTHKGSHIPYVKKQYIPFAQNDLQFINSEIDWKMENSVGYFKKDKFEIDPSRPVSFKTSDSNPEQSLF
jgi:hypothetical protein